MLLESLILKCLIHDFCFILSLCFLSVYTLLHACERLMTVLVGLQNFDATNTLGTFQSAEFATTIGNDVASRNMRQQSTYDESYGLLWIKTT